MRSATLKTDVLAPMPRARVRTATEVKPGDLRNMRKAKRQSEKIESSQFSMCAWRTITAFYLRPCWYWALSRWEELGRGGTKDELAKPLIAVQRVQFPPD